VSEARPRLAIFTPDFAGADRATGERAEIGGRRLAPLGDAA
jgi:hypothetical protein